jgi:hypothetical protein
VYLNRDVLFTKKEARTFLNSAVIEIPSPLKFVNLDLDDVMLHNSENESDVFPRNAGLTGLQDVIV